MGEARSLPAPPPSCRAGHFRARRRGARNKLAVGDTFAMDFIAGQGTQMGRSQPHA